MLGVFAAYVLDAEVVDDESERDGAPIVLPEAGDEFALTVAVLGEALCEEFVREEAALGEAVHAAVDLGVDCAVDCDVAEGVFFDDFFGYIA